MRRVRLEIGGTVQGVGFRPFVFRLATELGLAGWASNSPQGLTIEAEGLRRNLDTFIARLRREKPPHASLQHVDAEFFEPIGYREFTIRPSRNGGAKTAFLLPDLATCDECLRDIFDLTNRRYLYPFTNCTHCGPRFTIIEALPYDRANTTMKGFQMCALCRQEYDDPRDRRFHAQPNACPHCGPQVELWDADGRILFFHHEAIRQTAERLRAGRILAMKGLGGFHLLADAGNDDAVRQLRLRKHREEKPLALMFPTLEAVRQACAVSDAEAAMLLSPQAPIVLLQRLDDGSGSLPIAPSVAPNNPYLGVMLPYTPLHHILMRELGIPVVATSGNLSDEPICIDEWEALARLSGIADVFLVHDRPILRHADDSVTRVLTDGEMILRRARGYAPQPISVEAAFPTILAVGGHLKNTVALNAGANIFISQHIGDLETEEAYRAFREVIEGLQRIYELTPKTVACDLHPDYRSTQFAEQCGLSVVRIQHHHAHVVSCMAENGIAGPALGVSWDGTGYGADGAIWGGEFLRCTLRDFERTAHFLPFPLPAGDRAVKEPRYTALGMLYAMHDDAAFAMTQLNSVRAFSEPEIRLLQSLLRKRINTPLTSSVGRLFDGVASLVGLRQRVAFEGQAAMELEFALGNETTEETYPYTVSLPETPEPMRGTAGDSVRETQNPPWVIDWRPMVVAIIEDIRRSTALARISAKFHNTLSEIIIDTAKRAGEKQVVLSGGCFQNRYLLECTLRRLRSEGFEPYRHRRTPTNDGGLSLGQAIIAYHRSL